MCILKDERYTITDCKLFIFDEEFFILRGGINS